MSPRPLAFAGWLVVALTVTPTLAAAAATDWPAFRGNRGDGVAAAGILDPAKGLEVVWKRPIGSGYSAISTAGGVGVTMAVDGEHDVVLAFDLATGKDRWKHAVAPFYKGHDGSDDGPIATPAIAGGRVFALGPRGNLVALDLADGTVAWSRTLGESDSRSPTYGHAASPVPVDDLILVLTGGAAGKTLLAVGQRDGAIAWSWGDDKVGYQTPLIAEVGGERQVVVFTNRHLAGLDPKTGAERWKHQHTTTESGDDFSGQPVQLGNGRFLIQLNAETAAVEVSREGAAWRTREVWRANSIQNAFAVPVLHQGTLYGYNSRFLTAVDPATGKTLWKSRPPGGLGMTLVDGQLVIVGEGGALVRVKATPAGYEEVGRAAALGATGFSTPTVIDRPGGGLVLVRNLTEMAALRVTASAADLPVVVNAGAAPVSAFAEFLSAVEKAPAADRQARVDAFLAAQKSLPIVDASGRVTFVARAKSDVGLSGNWAPADGDLAMVRVPGTDLFHRSVDLDPAAHYEYRLGIDYADPTADPWNPWRTAGPQGEGSDLRMPGFRVPAHLAAGAPEPAAKGKLETFELESKARAGKREITVYLPVGYESGSERYPLVVVNQGPSAKNFGAYPRVLDAVLGGAAAPAIVAFVPRTGFPEYATELVDAYADMVVTELLPALDGRYRTEPRRASRAIIGVTSGGQAALRTVARHPDAFGFLGVQTFFRVGPYAPRIFPLVREAKLAGLRVWVESSPADVVDPRQGYDSPADTRELIELLKSAGADVQVSSTAGPGSWGRWRSTLDLLLAAFVPPR